MTFYWPFFDSKQAGREVVKNIRRKSSVIAGRLKSAIIKNKIIEDE